MVRESTNIENGSHGNNRVLNFSGSSMTISECKQLCKNIVNSDCLDSIRFSDCLLPEEIAKSIINALAYCKSIKVADFKGNNFRANGAEQLCKLLKQTTTLSELYLEWNALGLYDTSMGAIAEGVAVNKSVEILDLSNNQICHTGGKLLSVALKRNKTLKSLDLRWNNIGVAGGRELLSALQHNKTLLNLQLAGNNIPSDTLKAISTAIQRNVDQHTLYQQHVSMLQSLKDEIDHIENEKRLEVTTLANELEKEKELHESFTLTTHCKLEELKSTLDHVSNEKELLTKVSTQRENELKTASEKIINLEENLSDLTKVNAELRSTHIVEVKTLEDAMSAERKKWDIERAAKDSLISTLRKEKETKHNQIEKHQIEINNLQNLLKLKEENQIADEQKYQREKERYKREYEEQGKALTDKIMKHLHDKEQLEEEITKLKTSIMNNKLMFDEELGNQRSRWKQEDAFKSKQYEERIDILVASKDELQSKISKLMIQETETHAKLVSHQKDIENYKQVIVQNQESANHRDQEHRNEINKLRNEIDQEKRECRNLRGNVDDAEKKYADVQCEMTHMRTVKDSEIAIKENEILSLKEVVKNKEDEIKRIRQEELNRSNMLESALQTYILSARSTKH